MMNKQERTQQKCKCINILILLIVKKVPKLLGAILKERSIRYWNLSLQIISKTIQDPQYE